MVIAPLIILFLIAYAEGGTGICANVAEPSVFSAMLTEAEEPFWMLEALIVDIRRASQRMR
jgi:hypothetical protein